MAHKQTKKQLEKIRQLIRQVSVPTPSQSKFDWTTWTGLAIGALGLILATIGLRPKPAASYSPPTDPARLLSSQFMISNDGYLQLSDVHAICYIEKADPPGVTVYGIVIRAVSPGNATLAPSDAFTVPCDPKPVQMIQNPVQHADLAIVVTYRPWPFTFIRQRRFFRFVSRRDGDTISWDRQPVSVLEDHFNWLAAKNPNLSMFN
jgi:hypothetical protein